MALTKLNYTGQGTIPIAKIPNITGAKMPAGSVVQTIQGSSNARYVLNSANTWENTGFVSLTFPNALQSNSKVLVRINVLLGEVGNSSWASRTAVTIFENSTNKGHSDYGICSASAHAEGSVNTQHAVESMSGELLFTPSVTNGTYTLYCRAAIAFSKTIGGTANTAATYPVGNTKVTLQEIKQ